MPDEKQPGQRLADPPKRVAIVMAMEAEAGPLRSALGAEPIDVSEWARALPCRVAVADATASRPEVVLAVNGTDPATGVDCVGSTAAALTTQVALQLPNRPVDLVLSVGTCGGWHHRGAAIGDTVIAWPEIRSHDRRIDLPGFQAFADGGFPTADLRPEAEELGCRLGIVSTGDSLDSTPIDDVRMRESGADAKEMEAAAVAWVCQLHGVPIGAIKSITDLVDAEEANAEQFLRNLDVASHELQRITLEVLERIGAPR